MPRDARTNPGVYTPGSPAPDFTRPQLPPKVFNTLLTALFPLMAGIWVTLVGFEVFGKRPGAEMNPRYGQRQRIYRIGGPIVIVLSLILVAHTLAGYYFAVEWRTYMPKDGRLSIELPGPPEETVVEEQGPYGPTWNHFAKIAVQGRGISFLVRHTQLPPEFPDETPEELEEILKQIVVGTAKVSEGKVLEETALKHPAGVGRQFRIQLQQGYILRGEIFFIKRMQYQLQVVAPADQADGEIPTRFFESFSYHDESDQ